MINKILSFSINNKLLVGILTLALLFTGLWSATRVPLDAVPDITNNQVQVITQAPNLGTEEIEQFVTYPVELAMSNLPGVEEIRSISRFGLSVVTVVFNDDMGTYLPRQLVSEKLAEIQGTIPQGFGTPSIGPISTGLGEIYQYTLEVDSAHRDKYDLTYLRTIQDWVVARQMAMTEGVVEINSVGGNIKQYEVVVNPDILKQYDLTIMDVFTALETNNQNTGGAYIEKNHMANFIRGIGLVHTKEDLENIHVKTVNNIPLLIKDIAKVQFGKAIRYGAITQNGQGEAVGGLVMMIKGGNSNDVIKRVKERVQLIQKSLPEGIKIKPLIERSTLIKETTGTVSQNLMEGALIVIFVLVILLGNWRGGLIVASTIPLSLLFAFIMMYYFGVWANLMSLGAIDFGIIIDGAVIIVETTVFLLHDKLLKNVPITSEQKDETAYQASSKMMNSAFFGQLIILIVFIPILALQGVEGKMFKPMALTFMFAMIGVMVLCLTYVPMMSALLINAGNPNKKTLGDKIVDWLEHQYEKALNVALKFGKFIILGAIGLLIISVITFGKMGGEFVPQLDEGDLAFHVILKPGSSLSETVAATTKVEKMVKDSFPEIVNVVSRIGVAEVPTDPMPMDVADVIAIVKPKDEWTTVTTKDELIEEMKKDLSTIPGINYEFTQPIEMRFNELLEGIREDVAIKLYGEDLNILAAKANEITQLIAGIDGIGDMKAEAISGLPQMTIHYKRNKIAQYNLSVNDVNRVVESAFAGGHAGVVFEGEKRFDIVVRMEETFRKSIQDIKDLFVQLPNGNQVKLSEIADISYEPGPMQISRDNTNRRTYVGINVRGRDVKSLVEEIQSILDKNLELPTGYYIRYGGTFENLERASKRLQLVVPIALGLIFVLIFFALKSFKQTIMIYLAIPLAAIGGVFSLWLRDMPFSISAGVGFIVLFGVAVLNGLVLISGWNELKEEGESDIYTRIIKGARRRIRPILLTALTDILGFLPMALSTSAGAEVQQPLATVVIGGMISATLLTLFVLPNLYKWFDTKSTGAKTSAAVTIGLLFLTFNFNSVQAQTPVTTVDEAIAVAMKNNGSIIVSGKQIDWYKSDEKTNLMMDKTGIDLSYGQYNSEYNDFSLSISQAFKFPSAYSKIKQAAVEATGVAELSLAVSKNEIAFLVREEWTKMELYMQQKSLLEELVLIYDSLEYAANRKFEVNETNYLEKLTAETKSAEIHNQLEVMAQSVEQQKILLGTLLQDSVEINPIAQQSVFAFTSDSATISNNPNLRLAMQKINLQSARIEAQKASNHPDFNVGYINQSMIGNLTSAGNVATMSNRFHYVNVGIAIPIFRKAYKSQVNQTMIDQQIAVENAKAMEIQLQGKYMQILSEIEKQKSTIQYYEENALKQAETMLEFSKKSYRAGETSFVLYLETIKQASQIKQNYMNAIFNYNKAINQFYYLIAQ